MVRIFASAVWLVLAVCLQSAFSSGVWNYSNSQHSADSLHAVAYGNGAWVAVGQNGTMYRFGPGIPLQALQSGTAETLRDITWANGKFIAVGDNGAILTSSDGVSWEAGYLSDQLSLTGIAWNQDSSFVLATAKSFVYKSSDFADWERIVVPGEDGLVDIAWNSDGFIAAGTDNWLESMDGNTWTSHAKSAVFVTVNDSLRVVWGNDSLVIIHPGKSVVDRYARNYRDAIISDTMVIALDSLGYARYYNFHSSIDSILGQRQKYGKSLLGAGKNGSDLAFVGAEGAILFRDSAGTWFDWSPADTTGFASIDANDTVVVSVDGTQLDVLNLKTGALTTSTLDSAMAHVVFDGTDFYLFNSKGSYYYKVNTDYSLTGNDFVGMYGFKAPVACRNGFLGYRYLGSSRTAVYYTADFSSWTKVVPDSLYTSVPKMYCGDQSIIVSGSRMSEMHKGTSLDSTSWSELRIPGNLEYSQVIERDSSLLVQTPLGVYQGDLSGTNWVHNYDHWGKISSQQSGAYWVYQDGQEVVISTDKIHWKRFWLPTGTLIVKGDYLLVSSTRGYLAYAKTAEVFQSQEMLVPNFPNLYVQGNGQPPLVKGNWTVHTNYSPPLTVGSAFYTSVFHDGNRFLVFGEDNRLESADGYNWVPMTIEDNALYFEDLKQASNGVYYGVGNSGLLQGSDDLITWDHYSTTGGDIMRTVTFNDSIVLIGGEHNIMRSTDGVHFRYASGTPYMDVHSMAYGKGVFVAVGWGFGNNIYTSTDGESWTQLPAIGSDAFFHIVFDGSKFVAVGYQGEIATSSNGTLWLRRTSPVTGSLVGLCWTGSQYVAVGDSGVVVTSPDAISWTRRTTPTKANLSTVASDANGKLVAVGDSSTVITSTDGVHWTRTHSKYSSVTNAGPLFYDVEYAPGKGFVAGGQNVLMHFDSPGGTKTKTTLTNVWVDNVIWNGTYFMAMGGASVYRSTDGKNWSKCNVPVGLSITNAAYSPQLGVWAGITNRNIGYSSDNGLNWVNQTSSLSTAVLSSQLRDIIWDGSMFVVTVYDGTMLVSADGVTWTEWRNVYGDSTTRIGYSGSDYLITAGHLPAYYASDITNPTSTGYSMNAQEVIWDGSRFAWTSEIDDLSIAGFYSLTEGDYRELVEIPDAMGIAASDSIYVVVGRSGNIASRSVIDSVDSRLIYQTAQSQTSSSGGQSSSGNSSNSGTSSSSAGSSTGTSSSNGSSDSGSSGTGSSSGETGSDSNSSDSNSSETGSSEGDSSSSSDDSIPLLEPKSGEQWAAVKNRRLYYVLPHAQAVAVSVKTVQGKTVKEFSGFQPAGNYFMDLHSLTPGNYFIVVNGAEQVVLKATLK